MTAVVSKNIRNRVGDLTLQVFGTGPYGTLTPTASGGVVSIPPGYRIIFAVGNGEARIAQIQQGVDVSASNNDVIYAVITGQEITAIEAAASAPAGSQILGTATGTPVDTFTQDARVGGKTDLVFDSDAVHGNVAAEISAIALKATPVAADLVVIEDSAAANAKKRATVGSLGGGGVFGTEYDAVEDLADSINGTQSLVTKLTLTKGAAIPSGTYRVGFYCEVFGDSGITFDVRLVSRTPSTTVLNFFRGDPQMPFSGFHNEILSGADQTFELEWRRQDPSAGDITIRAARVEFWRVA